MSPTRTRNTFTTVTDVKRHTPFMKPRVSTRLWHDLIAAQELWMRIGRVGVLGEDDLTQCHSGCVNALHWSSDGSVLVSAGDDTRIHLWRLDPSDTLAEYPLRCTAKIYTGHTNNIFNAHILPTSSRIATCAADRQVRVFDINRGGLSDHNKTITEYQEDQACIRVLRCHRGRVKRIITENSPDYFLTVAEDGSVRQHDLRTPHRCSKDGGACPPPLLKLPMELSTIALSPLTPWNFVVAGESPYGYLFDRRQTGRHLKEEWGVECESDDMTSCVRRFGRRNRSKHELTGYEHVTGSRMSSENGHELILSYSADATYLYSIRDSPEVQRKSQNTLLPSNKRRRLMTPTDDTDSSCESKASKFCLEDDDDIEVESVAENSHGSHPEREMTENYAETDDHESADEDYQRLQLPIVFPQRRFVGACNIETVKDANFVGPRDEYVVSGSDDGNFFLWDKRTGQLLDIHEGDGTVVNVIEQHPKLPVLAVSGIDHTVKIFAPTSGSRRSSRMANSDEIVRSNTQQASQITSHRPRFADVFLQYRRALNGVGALPDDVECVYQ